MCNQSLMFQRIYRDVLAIDRGSFWSEFNEGYDYD